LNNKISGSTSGTPTEVAVNRVCTTNACESTQIQSYSVFYDGVIKKLAGTITRFTMNQYDAPIITRVTADLGRKTSTPVNFEITFTDRVPAGCDSNDYSYRPVFTNLSGAILADFTDSTTNAEFVNLVRNGNVVSATIRESMPIPSVSPTFLRATITDQNSHASTKELDGWIMMIEGDVASVVAIDKPVLPTADQPYYPKTSESSGSTLIYTIVLKDAAGNIIR
jgi:hypothetical protein